MNRYIFLVILLCQTAFSQTIFNVGIGPTWPREISDTDKKTSWNGTIEIGHLFDNVVGFGVDFDFSWNVNDSVVKLSDSVSEKAGKDKYFMFPVSAQLFFDPIAKYKIHPVLRGQFGLNMMVRDLEEYDPSTNEFKESIRDGFYIGFIGKGGIDAVFDIGEHAAVYAGFEYQAGKLRHKLRENENKNAYTYFNFNAPGIRMGLSFLF